MSYRSPGLEHTPSSHIVCFTLQMSSSAMEEREMCSSKEKQRIYQVYESTKRSYSGVLDNSYWLVAQNPVLCLYKVFDYLSEASMFQTGDNEPILPKFYVRISKAKCTITSVLCTFKPIYRLSVLCLGDKVVPVRIKCEPVVNAWLS